MNPTTGGAGCCARAASGQRSDESATLPSPAMNSRRFTDHLVGGGQKRFWDGKAEGFGGFEVESQLDFYGLLDRQIGWFLAFEDAALPGCRRPRSRLRDGGRDRLRGLAADLIGSPRTDTRAPRSDPQASRFPSEPGETERSCSCSHLQRIGG